MKGMAEKEARVLQLAREGMSGRQIAPLVGFAHGHVCRIIRRHGMSRGKGAHKPQGAAFPGSEYNDEERRFLMACDAYRCRHDRKFLTALDYLAILKTQGYHR